MAVQPNFGTDLSCTTDLDALMVSTSGLHLLSQAIYRRLTTPRGCVINDPNYGYDLQTLLNDDLNPSDVGPYTTAIQNECLKDQRVIQATAVLQLLPSGVLLVTLTLTTASGPFTLVISVSQLTVALLQAA